MWHEARKQEKKIRCMLVDYQRRAQRRKDYYDKIKADPTQFLQLHGRPCKIHLDPAVCLAAQSSTNMMPWQGNTNMMIDRFDVRAHLDYIPEIKTIREDHENLSYEERQINYERYRILVQNDFFNIPEDKFLYQISLEEKYGSVLKNVDDTNSSKRKATAAIGYNYDEDGSSPAPAVKTDESSKVAPTVTSDGNSDDEDSESDIDLDLTVDVSKIETQQANELNTCAHAFGMQTNDFFSFLNNDLEEAENMRIVKEQEEEKAMFSGRKSRKERRAFRERTLVGRKLSPPSYAWRKSPSYEDYRALVMSKRSRSKSSSPINAGKITYITCFGDDEPASSGSIIPKSNSVSNSSSRKESMWRKIRSHSRSKDRTKRKRSRSTSSEADKRKSNHFSYQSRSTSRSVSRSRSHSRFDKSKFRRNENDKNTLKHSSSRSRSRSNNRSSPVADIIPKTATDDIVSSATCGPNIANSPDPITIPRYYGRRRDESSSSELSMSSDDDTSKQSQTNKGGKTDQIPVPVRSYSSNKGSASSDSKLTPQERLRRKRQVLLNKQFKADKRAEREKVLKMNQERIDRAEEMKELSIKLRRRQRELRHNDSSGPRMAHSSRSESNSSSDNCSVSRSPSNRRSYRRNESSSNDSDDSDKKRGRKRYSASRSRSKSRRSRSPRRSRNSWDRDKSPRSRHRRSSSPFDDRSRKYDGHRTAVRRDTSPRSERRRDRMYDNDRHRNSRSTYSRRSSSRDRYSSRYDR